MNIRDEILLNATKAWVKNNKAGTLVVATGVGKTKIGTTIAVKQLLNQVIESVLIVVPTTVLIEQWRDEIIKWYGEDILRFINIVCVQTAYKHDYYADLLIVDEIHTALSSKYSKIFTGVLYKQILGLTATVPEREDHRDILNQYAPVCFEYNSIEAGDQGIIADCKIYNLEISLNAKDRGRYRTFDGMFSSALIDIGRLKSQFDNIKHLSIFDVAKEFSNRKPDKNSFDFELVRACKNYWNAMTMRKWSCYEAESKIEVVVDIINKFPGRKWILFNKSIKFAEKLNNRLTGSLLYHSKMKDLERQEVLSKFANNESNILISVDALNAGLNVPDADSAIDISGVSTPLVGIQRTGRVRRKQDDKLSLYINLYCKDTIEKSWVTKRTANQNPIWINNVKHIKL